MKHIPYTFGAGLIACLLALGACGMNPTTSTAPTTSGAARSSDAAMAPMNPMGGMGGMGGMGAMASSTTALTARLSGASEVPAVVTDATGRVEVNLAPSTNMLSWKITYSGLSGPPTMAHFHGPAMAGQNAGVVLPINAPLTSPITGSAQLTPSQAADIKAGKWYVNLHTAANPGGEARGQVSVSP